MRTDTLIDALSRDFAPVRPDAAPRRLAAVAAAGLAVAVALVLASLGPRPDLFEAVSDGLFWMKGGFTVAVALAAWAAAVRAGRPGAGLGAAAAWVAAPFLVLAAVAVVELGSAPAGERAALWMGATWAVCPLLILGVSLPVLAGTLWAMRGAAPTRPALAGGYAGLLAGGVAASAYGLHCAESTAAFTITWYGLGVLASTALGAAVGPRVLRW